MPSKLQLIDMVAAKIDEVLPPGEGLLPSTVNEGPVNYMDVELDEAAKDIARKAPLYLVLPLLKNGTKHFPINPQSLTGLLEVGNEVTSLGNITSIENVLYRINAVQFGSVLMPVTWQGAPTALHSRRDIIVGNAQNELVYIQGTENLDPAILEYPDVPSNSVLVMRVKVIDGSPIEYEAATTIEPEENPDIRVIYDSEEKTSIIPVPTDFLRFVSLKLDRWKRAVKSLISQQGVEYENQKTKRFTRGTENKPIGAMISFTDYVPEEVSAAYDNKFMAIECFTAEEEPEIEHFHYIPVTLPENYPQELVDVLVLEAAARTLVKMKQYDASNVLRAQVSMYFENQIGVV